MLEEKRLDFEVNGVKGYFSTNLVALKSQSSVLARMGDTVILVTINEGQAQPEAEYFPLNVEYMEKMYAAGKISGSRFIKRERFPSEDATLKARAIDRSIRPRFASDYRNEVSVVVKVLAFDLDNDPLILAINTVSAALQISKLPFNGPVAGIRVGMKDGELMPWYAHVDRDDITTTNMNLVLAGDGEKLVNIDANSIETAEDKIIEAMEYGLQAMKSWLELQDKFVQLVGTPEKSKYTSFALSDELIKAVADKYEAEINENMKQDNRRKLQEISIDKFTAEFAGTYSKRQIREAYEVIAKNIVKKLVLEDGTRVDGRSFDKVRELDVKIGFLPRVHGSGLFTRGKTQVLTIATLGSSRSQQEVDDMTGEDSRRYLHYYVDGPYSHGEAGRISYMPGRREVGHGALAEKALYPVLPSMEEFPYMIMLMSEILSEHASSSQGSATCSSLALMDAGVPIKRSVAGIAIGLVVKDEECKEFETLVDMMDIEDFYGYMDFKVAGTREGITAIQMDTKLASLPMEVFKKAIVQAKNARFEILDAMDKVISKPKADVSEYAPKLVKMKVPVDKIGMLIGPGGKNIKSIIEDTGADIDIEDDGTVNIFAVSKESLEKAKERVEEFSFEPVVGEIYDGIVAKVVEFGAFVDIKRGVSGLVHVSEISGEFIKNVHDVIKEGDHVRVKLLSIDHDGKMKLSIKAAK